MPSQDVEFKDKELFNKIAASYCRKDVEPISSLPRKYQTEFALEKILKNKTNMGLVLEIACGIGATAKYFSGRYEKYIGVDYSKEMIEIAKWYNSGLKNVNFISQNVKEIDLSEKADVILAIGALHHMQNLDEILCNLKRNAKVGANFIALEPFGGNPIVQGLRRFRAMIDSSYSPDQVYFSRSELISLLERNGFKEIEVLNCNYFTPPFAQVVFPLRWIFLPLVKFSIALDRWFDRNPRSFGSFSWNLVVRAKF